MLSLLTFNFIIMKFVTLTDTYLVMVRAYSLGFIEQGELFAYLVDKTLSADTADREIQAQFSASTTAVYLDGMSPADKRGYAPDMFLLNTEFHELPSISIYVMRRDTSKAYSIKKLGQVSPEWSSWIKVDSPFALPFVEIKLKKGIHYDTSTKTSDDE